MKNLSDNISNMLMENGLINKADVESCSYGLEIFFSSVIEIICIFAIAILVDNFFETVIFFAFFIPLRIYSGGYHADTRIRCFLVSVGVYVIFSFILELISVNWLGIGRYIEVINAICVFFNIAVIVAASPCVHHNKNLNINEIKYFRKMSIWICCICSIIIFIFTFALKENIIVCSMVLGQLAETLAIIAAKIKEKFFENK